MSEPEPEPEPDIHSLKDEINLQEALYNSLENRVDAQDERARTQRKLKLLRAQLTKMQPPSQALPDWGGLHVAPDNTIEDSRATNSTLTSPANAPNSGDQHFVSTSDLLRLPNRKRPRLEDDFDLATTPKSQKATSQGYGTSPSSLVDDFDLFDDEFKTVLGGDWREEERKNKEYFRQLASKKRQEDEDAAFARQLQQQWDEAFSFQPVTKPNPTASSSYSQSYMRPDGSWQKPIPQPAALRVKSEFKSGNTSSGAATPLTDSSSSLEEISAGDWDDWFGSSGQNGDNTLTTGGNVNASSHPQSYTNANPYASFPGNTNTNVVSQVNSNYANTMPGSFPVNNHDPNPYASAPGSSVYGGGSYNPYGSFATMPSGSSRAPQFDVFNDIPEMMELFGSRNMPFDLDLMPSPSHFTGFDRYADPAKTREELRDLLKHIRPDEDLTEEQLGEAQPKALKINLMPHQRKGFAWMKSMEEGTNKGGILADDMGLGKTVQALALILARPPEPGDDKPTLVVAPVALIQQWDREIKKFVHESHKLSVLILHQETRNKPWDFIKRYDVILTTYGTLSSDLKRKTAWNKIRELDENAKPNSQQTCPLLGDRSMFHRIILDEAQNIKNRNTKAAVAACYVKAEYRWCLSGTPMQNNVDEIYSLIKFCRIRPYHDYEKFARDIGRPLKRTSDFQKEKAMKQLQAILKAILLRRNKDSKIDNQPIIQLPEKRTVEDRAVFSKDELDFYKQLEKQAQIQFNRFLRQGTVGRHYSHALVLLLRLRQCCCSPQLVTSAKDFIANGPLSEIDHIQNARQLPKEVLRRLDQNEAFECPICMDAVENPIIFVPCGHTLCNECLQAMVDKSMTDAQAKLNCPHCRADINIKMVTDLESYLRVHHPDRPGVKPISEVEDEDDDDDSDDSDDDTDSSDDDNDIPDDMDEGEDLKDFVVDDDEEIEYEDEDDEDDEDDKKTVKQHIEAEEAKGAGISKKYKPEQKRKRTKKGKGKGKAKEKHFSLAELRKEGLKNKAAKKKYLKRLAKGFQMSAKIERTISLLQEIKDRGEGEKTIVFSSFTSFLDLLEVPLHKNEDLSCYVRYDGSMKASDRNASVIRFTDDPKCKIMLVSLKAGNAGLNLTAANHVIILDPFWNPFVEYQAADRCYRIGQTREVTIHRILIGESDDVGDQPVEDRDFTVEDRILRLQQKKKLLVETALDENAAMSLGRLTTRDLGYLFGVNAMD